MKRFTEDEKTIARNMHKSYKWMVRDKSGALFAYQFKPIKKEKTGIWDYKPHYCVSALFGQELFRAIKWEDDEPTRIRDIYDPHILDDAEREYLGTVLKPFHDDMKYVVKHDGIFTFTDFDEGKMH